MEFIIFFFVSIIRILKYAILIRILLSWIRPGQSGRLSQMLYEITEPLLGFIRNILPKTGMIDLSPIIAFFVLDFAQIGIIKLFTGL